MPLPRPTLLPYTTLFRSAGPSAADEHSTIDIPALPEWSERERLAGERETLGLFLTGHPVAEHEQELRQVAPARIADLGGPRPSDRKSTRLNSSHSQISYAAPQTYAPSLHDALPICRAVRRRRALDDRHSRAAGMERARAARGRAGDAWPVPHGTSGRGTRAGAAAGRAGPHRGPRRPAAFRSEEHTSELQSQSNLVCRSPDLRSFPTRRSSDLPGRPPPTSTRRSTFPRCRNGASASGSRASGRRLACSSRDIRSRNTSRSCGRSRRPASRTSAARGLQIGRAHV